MSQRNLLILLAATVVSYACYVRGEQNPYARYVASGFAAIEHDSLAEVPRRELFNGAMQGMVDVLHEHGDQHSQFIPEQEAAPFRVEILQQFGGIGVRIRFLGDPPRLTIVGPPDPGTPAARANLMPGDRILEIDGQPTEGMTMLGALHLMRGKPGETLRLTIAPADGGPAKSLQLVREVITIDSILGDVRDADGRWQFRLQDDPRIAHVRVTSFGDKTADEFERVLTRLADEHVQAVILDLRDDAGGAVDTAVALCNMLLPGGLAIVETRGRDQTVRQLFTSSGTGQFVDMPLAVLVNQNTASASEIVAACLQDHHRAVIVGQRTYGKGTVQELVSVESGRSLLKLTSASYWRPSGRNIDRLPDATDEDNWGVSPDPGLEVSLSASEYAEYLKYRNDRDTLIAPERQDAAVAAPDAPSVPFIDRPLQRATEYLQGMLDHDVPLASSGRAAS
jgi:carboxyl-terminal processing protease